MYARAQAFYTEAEYLALEAASDRKHEFIDGEIIAMAGGSPAHNVICANIIIGIGRRLLGRPCRVVTSDQRVCVEESGTYVYPDVAVVCPPFETREDSPSTFVAPRLVVEVLSPGTEGHDRNRKWPLYQSVASLHDVLLVEQSTRRVQHHRRVGPSEWLVRFVTEGEVTIEGLEVTLPLDEIYAGVDDLPG